MNVIVGTSKNSNVTKKTMSSSTIHCFNVIKAERSFDHSVTIIGAIGVGNHVNSTHTLESSIDSTYQNYIN